MHKTNRASSVWGSLSGSSTRPEQNKSYLTVPTQLINFSRGLAFCFSSAKLCDQSVGPRQRPRLAPRLIRHLALRVGNGGQQQVIRSGCVDRSASRHKGSSVWGLEVSVSHSVSPTHDAREPGFTYPHLPVPCPYPSTSIWFSLPGWIYERLLFLLKPHRLRQKQRDNPLCTADTQTRKQKTSCLWKTHTPQTKSNKQKPKYTPRWLQTQRKGINGCLKDLYSLQSLDRQRFPQKLPDSRLSCKWGACLDSDFWGKQTYIGGQLRRQGCHLLLRGVQLATQLSDLLFGLGEKVQR